MSSIKVMIVEDEFIVAQDIAMHLKSNGYEVLDPIDNGEQAILTCKAEKPDIVLMDINLGKGMNGIEAAKSILKNHHLPLIFITAYSDSDMLVRAKQLKPHAYIIKPFNIKNLFSSIEIALYNFSRNQQSDSPVMNEKTEELPGNYISDQRLFIKNGYKIEKICINDIVFLEADGSYCKIITGNNHYTVSNNLQHMLDKINHQDIIRSHRSYAVNINKIESIANNKIQLPSIDIPVSRSYKSHLMKLINK